MRKLIILLILALAAPSAWAGSVSDEDVNMLIQELKLLKAKVTDLEKKLAVSDKKQKELEKRLPASDKKQKELEKRTADTQKTTEPGSDKTCIGKTKAAELRKTLTPQEITQGGRGENRYSPGQSG